MITSGCARTAARLWILGSAAGARTKKGPRLLREQQSEAGMA